MPRTAPIQNANATPTPEISLSAAETNTIRLGRRTRRCTRAPPLPGSRRSSGRATDRVPPRSPRSRSWRRSAVDHDGRLVSDLRDAHFAAVQTAELLRVEHLLRGPDLEQAALAIDQCQVGRESGDRRELVRD